MNAQIAHTIINSHKCIKVWLVWAQVWTNFSTCLFLTLWMWLYSFAFVFFVLFFIFLSKNKSYIIVFRKVLFVKFLAFFLCYVYWLETWVYIVKMLLFWFYAKKSQWKSVYCCFWIIIYLIAEVLRLFLNK